MTLTEFLTARLDEDEADARGDDGSPTPIGMWDPDRVLAEVAAKRAIVDMAGRSFVPSDAEVVPGMSPTQTMAWLNLTYLAALYADHPDYDEAWRP
jgi:hypothetical protein